MSMSDSKTATKNKSSAGITEITLHILFKITSVFNYCFQKKNLPTRKFSFNELKIPPNPFIFLLL